MIMHACQTSTTCPSYCNQKRLQTVPSTSGMALVCVNIIARSRDCCDVFSCSIHHFDPCLDVGNLNILCSSWVWSALSITGCSQDPGVVSRSWCCIVCFAAWLVTIQRCTQLSPAGQAVHLSLMMLCMCVCM